MKKRRPKKIARLLLLPLIAVHIQMAGASNWLFLHGSALEAFDDKDVQLLMAAATEVVSDPETPAKREWKNEKTGHHGQLQTLSAFTGPNGIRCKKLRVVSYAGTVEGKSTYTMCDMPSHGWHLVPSGFASPPKQKP